MYTFVKCYQLLREAQINYENNPNDINKKFKEYHEIQTDEAFRQLKIFIAKTPINSPKFQDIFSL